MKSNPRPAPIPAGYHTITPRLSVQNAADAIAFYCAAFGAVEVLRAPGPGGTILHAVLRIGSSVLHLNDEFGEGGLQSPQALAGSSIGLDLYVEDVDAAFQRALQAGATVVMPVQETFWGDRCGILQDPFGHQWSLASRIADLSPHQLAQKALEQLHHPIGE